jgi:NUMOD3 motif
LSVSNQKQKPKKFKFRHSKETIERIRKAMIGRHRSEESKRKMSLSISGVNHPMYGKHHTEETRQKLRIAHLGKKLSEEHKYKINVKRIAYWKRERESAKNV